MKLKLAWFGRAESDWDRLCLEYRRRLDRRWPAQDLNLKPCRKWRDDAPAKSLAEEADRLRKACPDSWRQIALSPRGRQRSSEELAAHLRKLENQGCPGLCLAIGSDLGLDRGFESSADELWSLGPMTFPHQLARLVLWEQLYRASDILAGGRYHRG